MKVALHDHLGRPIVLPATRVVVQDEHGNPLMIAVEDGPGTHICGMAGDPDFPNLMKTLGIDRTLIVTKPELPTL